MTIKLLETDEGIYGWGEEVMSNAVDVLIHGMRKKLGAEVIRNVRGLGWRITATAPAALPNGASAPASAAGDGA